VASFVLVGALMAFGIWDMYPLMTFGLCLFVALTIIVEFYRGATALQRKQQLSFIPAVVELTHRNTRRYGGYLVHMGMVFMFVGFAGAAFNQMGQSEMSVGDSLKVGAYEFHLRNLREDRGATWMSTTAVFDVDKNGKRLGSMEPEQRVYTTGREPQPTGLPDIRARANEDVYLVFAGFTRDGKNPIIQAYINPLVNWVWLGGLTLVFGTWVALIPSKVRRVYPKTRIVGSVASKTKTTQGGATVATQS
jgi:cytochrome c-type biogenesis protein CcmF